MLSLKRDDIAQVIDQFMRRRTPGHRFASFDYCYRYFRCSSGDEIVRDIEKSCLCLGFYLASWGMFRGKSSLLQRSAAHYEQCVRYIAEQPKSVWDVDVCIASPEEMQMLRRIYNEIRDRITAPNASHLILVTKVMLGVFGSVPAFDRYFSDAFRSIVPSAGFRTFGEKSLRHIQEFYTTNRAEIDKAASAYQVLAFNSSSSPALTYPRAKIVDMYGFQVGNGENST